MPGTSDPTRSLGALPVGPSAWRRPACLAAALAALALLVAFVHGASASAAGPTRITEAPPLNWEFKASWANYAFEPQVEGGASVVPQPGQVPNYQLHWQFESGSYDQDTRTTTLDYSGSAHWRKYRFSENPSYQLPPGYTGEPDPYLLDVTLANPQITISRDSSVITAELTSRKLGGSWELVNYGRVPLVNLEVLNVTPTVDGGTTSWSGILATMTAEGVSPFAGFYKAGTVLDDVGFSYTGPGGAPDFSEHFDEEGRVRLKQVQNELFITGDTVVNPENPPWIDRRDQIVHTAHTVSVDGVSSRLMQAFSLKQMRVLATTTIPSDEYPSPSTIVAYDTNEDRLLFAGTGEEGITRWLKFNLATDEYESGPIGDPRLSEPEFIGANGSGLAWDATRDQGWRIEGEGWEECEEAPAGECEWQLLTYKEGPGGIWEKHSYPIPGFGPGQFEGGYAVGTSQKFPVYATASDGSLIVLATPREESEDPDNPPPATIPGAYRIVLDEAAGTATVEPLPGTEVDNSILDTFSSVQTDEAGHILLVGNSIVELELGPGGSVHADPAIAARQVDGVGPFSESNFAIDPANGTVWYGGSSTQALTAIAGGSLLGSQVFAERNPRGGPVLVGDDHTVYAQTNDGSPSEFNGSKTWGWGKYELLGVTPAVTEQPQDASVSLGEGEASKAVTFRSTATGEPDAAVRWQEKAPGVSRFTDIAGATGPTLSVDAEPGMGGTEYRAVFTNAAGTVASEAATLAVEYAPQIALQLKSQTVTEGADASFSVVAVGNPAPVVTWTRRNGEGLWVPIEPTDENFRISQEGDTLTVLETNVGESGMEFRAVISNGVGTVRSDIVALTVNPRTAIPAGGIAVTHASLDWLGNEEMQGIPHFGGSNYFSAGVSDGKEDGYRSVLGDVAVWQVSSSGEQTLATYATRAAHTTDGGEQVARLYDGTGKVEADGSVDIKWDVAFSVNFYGGLVPFTIEDPELKAGPDGSGTLTATLVGCSSSMVNSNECAPFAPAAEVVVASFTGAEVEPGKPITVEPEYDGVTVDVPAGAGTQQLRSGPGWGSWPQSFVDFQLQTGLSSYWYSSGEEDEKKPPLPFTVDLEGPEPPPSEPKPEEKPSIPDGGGAGGGPSSGPGTVTSPGSKAKPPKLTLVRTARLDKAGAATIARLACPKGGAACETIVPARLAARIGGRRWLISVAAPKKIRPGHSAAVTVRLPRGARRALGHRKVALRLRIVLRSGKKATSRVVRVTIQGRG